MRLPILVAFSVLVIGCGGGVIVTEPAGDTPGSGGGSSGGGDPGGGGGGSTSPCPVGQHLEGITCVANEIICAAEFGCPSGLSCRGGLCVSLPDSCRINDDCPVGMLCQNGTCQSACSTASACRLDRDCGQGQACVGCACVPLTQCTQPTADLSGSAFTASHVLHLDEALGDFGVVAVSIVKKVRDGILGCPSGASFDCFLFQILASFLPEWSRTLIVALGNFGDIVDDRDFQVDSELRFTKSDRPSSYAGTDHWTRLRFSYQNQIVETAPQQLSQIGRSVDLPIAASGVCGVLYVDRHTVDGVLGGVLKWIVDTVVTLSSRGQYSSLGNAINGAIDCSQVYDYTVYLACTTFRAGIAATLDRALSDWLIRYPLMTLKGTAKVDPSGRALRSGHWDGSLGNGATVFKGFTGQWEATR